MVEKRTKSGAEGSLQSNVAEGQKACGSPGQKVVYD